MGWPKGKKLSREHRKNISKGMLGHKVSPETRRKISETLQGRKPANWKGGHIRRNDGYVRILSPAHPFADSQGYVFEHRLVMEKYLGRYLGLEEIVHHINGNPADNRIENLMLFASESDHQAFHHAERRGP